jgi:hypothetical protein
LIKVNEKSFQVPFCQMLIGEGYQVVHLSRHGSFEEGKDVIAIDPDGIPCAFQLKGSDTGKITQKEWAKYIDQIIRLVEIPIKHPSIDVSTMRKVYFVTNGELDEEVRVEISNRNIDWAKRGCPELTTIVKGELLSRFAKIHTDLWPSQLGNEKELLELYLANGKGYLQKEKFSHFLESIVFTDESPTKIEGQRKIANAALFTSYALSPFMQLENHIGVIEGWMIFISTIVAYSSKNKIKEKFWKSSLNIAEEAIINSLANLWEEVKTLEYFVTDNSLVDAPFYRARVTWIISFVAAYQLLLIQTGQNINSDEFTNFYSSNKTYLHYWGESATPQFLSFYWILRKMGNLYVSDQILIALLDIITTEANIKEGIPDPYHSLGEIVLRNNRLQEKYSEEVFTGRSYSLNSIILLFTRRGYKAVLAENWKKITSINLIEFLPEEDWQFFLWHCEKGTYSENIPKSPQSWSELINLSKQINLKKIPPYFAQKPVILLLFLLVYPQRLCPNTVKFLDDVFTKE